MKPLRSWRSLSSAQRGPEGLADDLFGAIAGRGRVAYQASDFGRLVAERLQRDRRFGDRILRHARARRGRGAELGHAIAKLDQHALGGLLADARNALERG